MKKYGRQINSVFLNFFISLIIMLVGPLIILTIVCFILTQSMWRQVYENNIAILQNSAIKIENTFQMMEEYNTYLKNDSDILKLYNIDNTNEKIRSITDVIKGQKKLTDIKIANNDLMNIQIFFGKCDVLIDYTAPVLNMERYYGKTFEIPGLTISEWYKDWLWSEEKSDLSQKQIIYGGGRKRSTDL